MELLPQLLALERDLGVVDDAVLLRLHGAQRAHHRRVVVVRGDGRRQHHVLGRRVGVGGGERVVRVVRVGQLGDERAGVAAVRDLAGAEGGQRRRREVAGRRAAAAGRRRARRRRAAAVGRRQQAAHAEVGLPGQLQEGVVGHGGGGGGGPRLGV